MDTGIKSSIVETEISCYITKTKYAYLLECIDSNDDQFQPMPMTYEQCENMAHYCRSFLSAWESVDND